MSLSLTFILYFSMCLLSFVYHLINGSIDQYITNDTVGVNDNPGLGRIRLPRNDRSISGSLRCSTPQRGAHAHVRLGSAGDAGAVHLPHPLPNNCTITPFHPSQHKLSGAWKRFARVPRWETGLMLKCQSTLMNTGGYNRDQGSLEEQEQCTTQSLCLRLALPDRSE